MCISSRNPDLISVIDLYFMVSFYSCRIRVTLQQISYLFVGDLGSLSHKDHGTREC